MKKVLTNNIFVAILLFVFGVQGVVYGQRYNNGLVDKTIALIGNEAVFLSQLEAEVQIMEANGTATDKNSRCQILENMLSHKLFLNQAKLDSLVVKEDNVEMELQSRLDDIMFRLGGEKATEKYFKKPLYKLKQDWREIFREQSLIQQMQSKVMSSAGSATPTEVKQFYKRTDKDSLPIISTQYKIRQIVLYPDKEKANLAVKEQLLELRERILKGTRFATLATMYSEDPGSAGRGGELGMASKTFFWPAFSDAAMSLKVGQVSQIVETPDGFHIIQMIEKDGDNFNARHILIKPKYTLDDKEKAFKTLDSIKHKILVDSLTFEDGARFYSEDPKSSISGGLMAEENSGSTLFEREQLKPEDYSIIRDLEEGEISIPFESTDNEGRNGNTIYKIIKIEKIIPSHLVNLEQDFLVIQNLANQKRQMDAIDKFIKEKQAITYIRIDELFKDCNFDREGWIK